MTFLGRTALLALAASALTSAHANSSNGNQEVLTVGIHDSGHAIITLASSSNTETCSTPALKNMALIQSTNPNFKTMYATALFALATGRPLNGWVNGCTDVWGTGGTVVVNVTTLNVAK